MAHALPLSEHQSVQPAVKRTILALRSDAMAAEPGTLIGAEEDLIKRYGVSRPTLRQAAGLVVQEQLLKVRRGVGGGYFADRPTFTAVAHMAAVFLQSRHTSLEEILLAIEPIRVSLVRLAAANEDRKIKQQWSELLEEERDPSGDTNAYRAFLRHERQFGELLGMASRNNVLNLFLQTLLELVGASTTRDQDVFIHRPERVSEAAERRARIIQAIISGDAEIAVLEAQRSARAATAWLVDDLRQAASPTSH